MKFYIDNKNFHITNFKTVNFFNKRLVGKKKQDTTLC